MLGLLGGTKCNCGIVLDQMRVEVGVARLRTLVLAADDRVTKENGEL